MQEKKRKERREKKSTRGRQPFEGRSVVRVRGGWVSTLAGRALELHGAAQASVE